VIISITSFIVVITSFTIASRSIVVVVVTVPIVVVGTTTGTTTTTITTTATVGTGTTNTARRRIALGADTGGELRELAAELVQLRYAHAPPAVNRPAPLAGDAR